MNNKLVIVLKVVSILSFLCLHIPTGKFDIPLGFLMFYGITERISELDFLAHDLYLGLVIIFSMI